MSHGGNQCQNTETVGKNANNVLPVSLEDVCWHLDKVKKFLTLMSVKQQTVKTPHIPLSRPTILFSISNIWLFNQQASALERRRILIIFSYDAVGAKTGSHIGILKPELTRLSLSIKMCQVSENKEQLQMFWHCWIISVGVGRKEGNSTQRAAGKSVIIAICDICKVKSRIEKNPTFVHKGRKMWVMSRVRKMTLNLLDGEAARWVKEWIMITSLWFMSQVSGIPLHFKNTCVRSTLQSFAIFSSETLSWITLAFVLDCSSCGFSTGKSFYSTSSFTLGCLQMCLCSHLFDLKKGTVII